MYISVTVFLPERRFVSLSNGKKNSMKALLALLFIVSALCQECGSPLWMTSRIPTHEYTLEEIFVKATSYYDAGFQVLLRNTNDR